MTFSDNEIREFCEVWERELGHRLEPASALAKLASLTELAMELLRQDNVSRRSDVAGYSENIQ